MTSCHARDDNLYTGYLGSMPVYFFCVVDTVVSSTCRLWLLAFVSGLYSLRAWETRANKRTKPSEVEQDLTILVLHCKKGKHESQVRFILFFYIPGLWQVSRTELL